MVTGYQRQHRKSIIYTPSEATDSTTTDQYTKLIMNQCNQNGVLDIYSRACEQSAVTGMVMLQPYLDYTGSDPAQGDLKVKLWEYNSFLVDPYAREADFSDANFMWFQEYISKKDAEEKFPNQINKIRPMQGSPQRLGRFYFLPENYNMARNDLLVMSYVWYKSKRKKKMLYSKTKNQFFDFAGDDNQLDQMLEVISDFEPVDVEVPTWKLCTVLNEQLMWQGDNPLGFDEPPAVPVFWNYDPQVNYYDFRTRSLVRAMRDPQFLLNRRIILNHDISEATVNAGWKRKSGAVANEDVLKKTGQGWDIVINDGYELQDCEKIIPSAVPESDMALADQMMQMIYSVSGVNLESWQGDDQKQLSGLTLMLKQGANLMVLQKYFDQWDYALKTLGARLLSIVLNNWNAAKVQLIIEEEPSPYFYSKVFAKYQVMVEEGLNTPTQKSLQAQQLLEINQIFGREVFPPSFIIKDMNLSGRAEAVEFLQQQEQMMQAKEEEASQFQVALEDAKLKELYAKAANELAMARERHGRAEADVGLFEERLSEITHNRAMATKAKMESLEKLIDVISKYGEIETALKMNEIESYSLEQSAMEDVEKQDAKETSQSNEFVAALMSQVGGLSQPSGQTPQPPL